MAPVLDRSRLVSGLLIVFFSVSIAKLASADKEPRVLSPDAPAEREIAIGEVHRYQLEAASGTFFRVVAEQRDVDLEVAVFEGERLVTKSNRPDEWYADESLSFIAHEKTGFRFELKALPGGADPGHYRIRVAELRPARPEDEIRVAAERAEEEANRLYYLGTADDLARAVPAYRTALERWRALGDHTAEAESLHLMGVVQRLRGENGEALAALGQSLDLRRQLGDRAGQAATLNQMGLTQANLSHPSEAFAAYEEALALRHELGNATREAAVLNNIALLHHSLGQLRKALPAYQQVLEVYRQAGDHQREGLVLNNLAGAYSSLGEPLTALRFYEQALATARSTADGGAEANCLNNLGRIHQQLGEAQQALECYTEAIRLFHRLGDRRREAIALANLGNLYAYLGETKKALTPFQQALDLQRQVGAALEEGQTLNALGRAYSAGDQPSAALESLQQALAIQRRLGDRSGEANTLSGLGQLYSSLSRNREAMDNLDNALAIQVEIGDRPGEARTRHRMGLAQAAMGDGAARASFSQALDLSRSLHDPAGEAAALQAMARIELSRGDPQAALSHLHPALDLVESLRGQVAGDRLRTSYFASWRDAYELTIEALMELHRRQPGAGHDVQAFETSERARARGLLDLLREGRVEIRSGADPQLLARERELRIQINAKSAREIRLQEAKASQDQLDETHREVEALLAEYGLLDGRIRAASPHYADLTRPAGVKLQDVQRHLLDEETLLLEISLGEAKSYLWTLTPSSFASFELPGRPAIEAAAKRAYESLSAPAPRDRTDRRAALSDLSRMLLGPVADRLAGRRLAVVAGGALQYIPFAALPSPGSKSGEPLVETNEVVVLPSVSVLGELRRAATGRKTGSLVLAVLADPVFGKDDPRLAASRSTTSDSASPAADLLRSADEVGASGFERLSWTRREAEGILAQADGRPVLKALDFEANRETATGPALANARVVHFATHGLLNNEAPELSGLVLSLVDREGKSQDGFLRLHDVYNLSLNSDLVVLSGCRTALGKEIRGEGLLGLTRGFLYAGSSRVMASLWPVRDRATAELMQRFYRALLRDGQPPAAALRAAQRSLRREPRWRDPYYWAPFVVQGDWRSSLP